MPLPVSKNVGKIMDFLKKERPNMPKKQKIAIALSQARKAGNKKIKKLPKQKDVENAFKRKFMYR